MQRVFLFIVSAILTLSTVAMADVKIKSKQTISGQTTENTTYIKGKRQRSEMMDGQLISVTQCDLGRDLQIAPPTKTYTVTYYDDGSGTPSTEKPSGPVPVTKGGTMTVTTTIKDTGERKQMFGFTARHIVQTIETETSADACTPIKSKMEIDAWVIDAEFGLACTQTRQYRPYNGGKNGGCQDKIVPKTIGSAKSGYPLWQKMTAYGAAGKETFTTVQEVVEMSKATLDQSLFEAPADYREVKNAAELYASSSSSASSYSSSSSGNSSSSASYPSSTTMPSSSGLSTNLIEAATPKAAEEASVVGHKKAGTIRLGLAGVKTAAVGEGINPAELSAAVQNTLGSFLKGPKVEIVPLEAKLASAQTDEAKQKECDFIVVATASHKKGGGGGFGFGKILAQTVAQTGIGHTGSVAGNIAGQVATTAIVSAGSFSGNVKSKDEITLDLKLQSPVDNSSPLTRQFKAKAKGDGDDIVSAIAEQAAQAIIEAVAK